MITRLKLSTIEQGLPKYRSMLAGNDAYVPPSFESIASATGTGSSGTITFSSIPSTYTSLHIRGVFRTDVASTVQDIQIRFNSDSGTNYADHFLAAVGSGTPTASSSVSTTKINGGRSLGSTIAADILSAYSYDIHDYASTSRYKTLRGFGGDDRNGNGNIRLLSGLWMSTSAITSVSFVLSSGNWTTQTSISLYGIKG